MKIFIISVIGYLFGCIHGSQLVGKYRKINIKNIGTKNAGATNTTILLGWKYGSIVAFVDVFKAILSISFILILLNKHGITSDIQMLFIYINALFVIIGHNYPITMRFKGGKGTASFIGMILIINWKIAIMGVAILLLFALASDYLAVGVLFMYGSFFTYTYYSFGFAPAIIAFLLFVLSIIKHLENYKRIILNEEIRLSSLFRKEVS